MPCIANYVGTTNEWPQQGSECSSPLSIPQASPRDAQNKTPYDAIVHLADVRIPRRLTHITDLPRRTDRKSCSSFPRVENTNSRALKVGYIPGRDGQAVHEGCGCDEGITIGARVRHVKRRASPGDIGVNRKDTA